jgi:hypothetical protein
MFQRAMKLTPSTCNLPLLSSLIAIVLSIQVSKKIRRPSRPRTPRSQISLEVSATIDTKVPKRTGKNFCLCLHIYMGMYTKQIFCDRYDVLHKGNFELKLGLILAVSEGVTQTNIKHRATRKPYFVQIDLFFCGY